MYSFTMGTTISLVVANICFMNWYYHNRINMDMIYFWKNIAGMCRGLLIPIIAGAAILAFINTDGIVRFAVFVCIYTVIFAVSMWFFGINEDEKLQVKSIVNRIRKR